MVVHVERRRQVARISFNSSSNRAVAATNGGRDAFERHQIALDEAKHQITVSFHLLFLLTVY
jgi:hypothetical protein